MLRKQEKEVRRQAQILTMESLVPEDHILRLIDEAIDFSFINELIEDKYCLDNRRPSIDPVTLKNYLLFNQIVDQINMKEHVEPFMGKQVNKSK